ncbi:hypothetical protein CVV43_01690 [Candidatus Saccharibacteria bacterium HGW-Saccharibacteria-1]|jgi:hypothetical protein|nr:MAG: hypothetical protein CVV43_01690 [Candidatus Saccharibacteria bacterium HGW-Saccharibacteria-1]
METMKSQNEKHEKGATIEQCINKADKFIDKNGLCLFLFDVKGSKDYKPRQELQDRLNNLLAELNTEFDEYLPLNNLAVMIHEEKGFNTLLGDSSWAGINSSKAITEISDYISKNYADINFRYDVAEDGYDEENTKIAK